MSKDRKLSPHEGWDAVEKMALKEEAERVGSLTDEALDRELERQGKDPKALRTRGQALAERLMAKARAPVATPQVVPSRQARPQWPLWLVAAVLAAIAITLVGMNRAAIVAWFQRSDEIRPDDRRRNESARARAEKLRDEADERCTLKLWGACEERLDEAMKLDPGGESEARVRHMRDIVDNAARAEAGPDKPDKPPRPR